MIDLSAEEKKLRKLHLRIGILKFVRRCGGRCHLVSVRGNFNRHTDDEFTSILAELLQEGVLVKTTGKQARSVILQETIEQEKPNGN
jgi:hypothetical protein